MIQTSPCCKQVLRTQENKWANNLDLTITEVSCNKCGNRWKFEPRDSSGSSMLGTWKLVYTGVIATAELHGLDAGIRSVVLVLRANGIETFESCEGGTGHSYLEPTVRFHGGIGEGFKGLAIALQHGFKVAALRRTWVIQDLEPTGPYWELTFVEKSKDE